MTKFNSFASFAEAAKKSQDFETALVERQKSIQAQMDAMWEARSRKADADRKAQMSMDWYLHK